MTAPGPDWTGAACRGADPELFHPEEGRSPARFGPAKQLCARCPLTMVCLLFGLDRGDQFGVLGGLTPQERRPLHAFGTSVHRRRTVPVSAVVPPADRGVEST